MVYRPNPEGMKAKSKEIIKARKWGMKIVMSLFVVGTVVSVIQKVFFGNPDIVNYLYLGLYLSVLLLIFFWVWASEKELEMLFTWLDPGTRYRPPDSVMETVLIIFFSVVLVGMLIATQNIMVFAIIFTMYSLIGIIAGYYTEKELRRAIMMSRTKIDDEIKADSTKNVLHCYKKAILIIEEYFVRRPMKTKGVMISVFSLVGLVFAARWAMHGSKHDAIYSYITYIAIILSSEYIINYWRFVRDSRMRAVLEDMDACTEQVPPNQGVQGTPANAGAPDG